MTNSEALHHYATRKDAAAFRRLVENYQRLVYAAAARRLAHSHDIEDTVQLTFLKLARAAATIKTDAGGISSWLYTTALNTANDLIRQDHSRRRHETAAALLPAAPATPADQTAADREELQKLTLLLDEALIKLPAAQQSLIIEHYFQSRSQRDLAAENKTTQATISRRLTAAVDSLRSHLRAQGYSAPLLPTSLATLPHPPVPTPLTAQLAKIGLAGTAPSATLLAGMTLTTKLALTAAALLTIALSTLALLPSKPPVPPARAASTPPAPPTPVDNWRTTFEKAYALLPNQNLKFIPTSQFPPERKQYFSDIEHNNTPMPFIQWRFLAPPLPSANPSPLKRELMSSHGPAGAPLATVLNACANLDDASTAINSLPRINADGDWIVRDGAPTQAILDDLRSILAAQFNLRVTIEKTTVTKDALVATGNYQFTRLPESTNRNNIEIFTDLLDHPRQGEPAMGGGTRPPAYLWSYLGDQLGIPIVDESKNEPPALSWSLSWSSAAATTQPAKRQQLLDHITQQTTLTFKPEKRPFTLWKFTPAAAAPATAPTAGAAPTPSPATSP